MIPAASIRNPTSSGTWLDDDGLGPGVVDALELRRLTKNKTEQRNTIIRVVRFHESFVVRSSNAHRCRNCRKTLQLVAEAIATWWLELSTARRRAFPPWRWTIQNNNRNNTKS